jgi:hypothetical protein
VYGITPAMAPELIQARDRERQATVQNLEAQSIGRSSPSTNNPASR